MKASLRVKAAITLADIFAPPPPVGGWVVGMHSTMCVGNDATEPTSLLSCLPHELLELIVSFMYVSDVVVMMMLNRSWCHHCRNVWQTRMRQRVAEKIHLHLLPPRAALMLDATLRQLYAEMVGLPRTLTTSRDDVDGNGTLSVDDEVLVNWQHHHVEEVCSMLSMCAEVVEKQPSSHALAHLILGLQNMHMKMWEVSLMDVEGVDELLSCLVQEHQLGWSIVNHLRATSSSRRGAALLGTRRDVDDGRRISYACARRWIAPIAEEYNQLHPLLSIIVQVSEVADHPCAARRYAKVWEEVVEQIPMSATSVGATSMCKSARLRNLSEVCVGDLVSYFVCGLISTQDRRVFLGALSMMMP